MKIIMILTSIFFLACSSANQSAIQTLQTDRVIISFQNPVTERKARKLADILRPRYPAEPAPSLNLTIQKQGNDYLIKPILKIADFNGEKVRTSFAFIFRDVSKDVFDGSLTWIQFHDQELQPIGEPFLPYSSRVFENGLTLYSRRVSEKMIRKFGDYFGRFTSPSRPVQFFLEKDGVIYSVRKIFNKDYGGDLRTMFASDPDLRRRIERLKKELKWTKPNSDYSDDQVTLEFFLMLWGNELSSDLFHGPVHMYAVDTELNLITRFIHNGRLLRFEGGGLFYTNPVTEEQARKVGQKLREVDFFDPGQKDLGFAHIGRADGVYYLRIWYQLSDPPENETIEQLKSLSHTLSRESLGGAPVDIELCNQKGLATKRFKF